MTKVLVIDDDQGVHAIINVIVKRQIPDCDFFSAYNGEEGIEYAERELPDAILLDVEMPGIDGYETCRRLKANESTAHIPIIIFTGMAADAEGMDEARLCGADAFLGKPISKVDLIEKIERVLELNR
ncbi:MAG TPA: response regulator [Deltaproteobacteria bacterium]|nr:response regulator [Deltaproteobacteria bacterium]